MNDIRRGVAASVTKSRRSPSRTTMIARRMRAPLPRFGNDSKSHDGPRAAGRREGGLFGFEFHAREHAVQVSLIKLIPLGRRPVREQQLPAGFARGIEQD